METRLSVLCNSGVEQGEPSAAPSISCSGDTVRLLPTRAGGVSSECSNMAPNRVVKEYGPLSQGLSQNGSRLNLSCRSATTTFLAFSTSPVWLLQRNHPRLEATIVSGLEATTFLSSTNTETWASSRTCSGSRCLTKLEPQVAHWIALWHPHLGVQWLLATGTKPRNPANLMSPNKGHSLCQPAP